MKPGKVGNRVVLGKGNVKSEDSKMVSYVSESISCGCWITTEPENAAAAAPAQQSMEQRQTDAQEGGGHLVFGAGDTRGNGREGEQLEQEIWVE